MRQAIPQLEYSLKKEQNQLKTLRNGESQEEKKTLSSIIIILKAASSATTLPEAHSPSATSLTLLITGSSLDIGCLTAKPTIQISCIPNSVKLSSNLSQTESSSSDSASLSASSSVS